MRETDEGNAQEDVATSSSCSTKLDQDVYTSTTVAQVSTRGTRTFDGGASHAKKQSPEAAQNSIHIVAQAPGASSTSGGGGGVQLKKNEEIEKRPQNCPGANSTGEERCGHQANNRRGMEKWAGVNSTAGETTGKVPQTKKTPENVVRRRTRKLEERGGSARRPRSTSARRSRSGSLGSPERW